MPPPRSDAGSSRPMLQLQTDRVPCVEIGRSRRRNLLRTARRNFLRRRRGNDVRPRLRQPGWNIRLRYLDRCRRPDHVRLRNGNGLVRLGCRHDRLRSCRGNAAGNGLFRRSLLRRVRGAGPEPVFARSVCGVHRRPRCGTSMPGTGGRVDTVFQSFRAYQGRDWRHDFERSCRRSGFRARRANDRREMQSGCQRGEVGVRTYSSLHGSNLAHTKACPMTSIAIFPNLLFAVPSFLV